MGFVLIHRLDLGCGLLFGRDYRHLVYMPSYMLYSRRPINRPIDELRIKQSVSSSYFADDRSASIPLGVLSRGIWRIPRLSHFFPTPVCRLNSWLPLPAQRLDWVAAWGYRPSRRSVERYARRHGLSILTLEDGFVRSMGLGHQGYPPAALVLDDVGVYFDAQKPSRLEQLITAGRDESERAELCMAELRHHRLSKYNHAPKVRLDLTTPTNILVVDQTLGDQSVRLGGADQDSFEQMLQAALSRHPTATIWIKTHPEVSSGHKKGYLSHVRPSKRIRLITELANPIGLIEQMDAVYVVTSHMGFEALMLDRPVYCFGLPWYAGWGLTDDSAAPIRLLGHRRGQSRRLTQLFTAAYFDYSRYVHPATGQACELERVIECMAEMAEWNEQLRGTVYCVGFSPWKRLFIRRFLHLPSVTIRFVQSVPRRPEQLSHLLVWGSKLSEQELADCPCPVWRMEDGFIRSIGLGAHLVEPMSLVLDDQGIYYDPSSRSRLQRICSEIQLSKSELQRARSLIKTLVEFELSKYNVGSTAEQWPNIPAGQYKILVAGQVEDDASIRLGTRDIQTNLQLLQAVRAKHPNAFIIYKPHPDVVAGLRRGVVHAPLEQGLADAVLTEWPMPACFERVDAVHTMTSLTGFEALIRGLPVTCYGMPFYAGWGLTQDRYPHPERRRVLTLEELVFAVLVRYPLYLLPNTEQLCRPEDVMAHIVSYRHQSTAYSPRSSLALAARLGRWLQRI